MKLFLFLLFLITLNSYLIFPIEYLPEENYKFLVDKKFKNKTNEDMMQKLYYRLLMTKIELGTPARNFTLIIDSDDDKYYIASSQRPKISNEPVRDIKYYLFDKSELLNESYSSSYKKGPCEAVDYEIFSYAELCSAKDVVNFNQNNNKYQKIFEFRMVRNNEDNIPGLLGLLYNFKGSQTLHPNFINELRGQSLIENNYWFMNFEKVSPFNRIIEGQIIIGGLPHDIFPDKYKKENYVETKKSKKAHFHGAWKIEFDKIWVGDKEFTYLLFNTQCVLNYEVYHIIGSLEFHFRMKENFMDELLEEKKCFKGTFPQNIHYRKELTFYYCNKDMKNFLYEHLPNIKFYIEDFGQEMEITTEELYYEEGDYIYLMMLFGGIEFNYFSLGQIFTTKYNFVFNNYYKEIGFYKTNKKFMLSSYSYYAIGIIIIPLISLFVGLMIGKKMFGKKGINNEAEELIDMNEINANKA